MQKRLGTSIGTLVIIVLAFAAPAQAVSLSTPNAKIRLAAGAWAGEAVLNETGAGQSIAVNLRPGRSVRLELGAENPLRSEMSAAVSGCGGRTGFRVRYETAGGMDLTELVTGGLYLLGPIPAYGDVEGLFLVVTSRPNAPANAKLSCPVTMASVADFAARDTVLLIATVR